MSAILREVAPENARKLAEKFQALGIAIPKDVADLLSRLEALEAHRPTAVGTDAVATAYANGDFEQAEQLARDATTAAMRAEGWRHGRATLGMRALSAWAANGNDLTMQLAALAEPLISKLNTAAEIDTHDTAVLIRAGRSNEAEVAARLDLYAADLASLYDLRRQVTPRADYGEESGYVCSVWRDPRKVKVDGAIAAQSTAHRYLAGIRAEGGLWFPLPEEAAARAKEIAREEATQRQYEEAAAIRARGGRVAVN